MKKNESKTIQAFFDVGAPTAGSLASWKEKLQSLKEQGALIQRDGNDLLLVDAQGGVTRVENFFDIEGA